LNGGSAVLDYRIKIKAASSSEYTIAATGVTTLSHTLLNLVLGTTYDLTVEARNAIGFSEPSEPLQILHALVPEKPEAPTTLNSGENVVISWQETEANGAPLTQYLVKLKLSSGLYAETSACTDTIASRSCSIPLSDLTSAPFSLSLGDPVFAEVIAVNAKGSSPESDAGSGATIISKPEKPTALEEQTAQRSASTLGISWTAGASDGGSPVFEFRVQMAILGQAFSILDSTTTTAYLATGLTAGVSYVFKVEARNEYGYSDLSAPLTLLCAYG